MITAEFKSRDLELIPGASLPSKDGSLALGHFGGLVYRTAEGRVMVDDILAPGAGRGTYYYNSISGSSRVNLLLSTNGISWHPFILSCPMRSDELRCNVTSGAAGGLFSIGIYSDDNVYPGERLIQFVDVPSATAGLRTLGFTSRLFPRSLYWICIASSASPRFAGVPQTSVAPVLGRLSSGFTPICGYLGSNSYVPGQGLPAIAPAGLQFTSSPPIMFLLNSLAL